MDLAIRAVNHAKCLPKVHRNVMINPFNDREIIENAVGLPVTLQNDETIIRAILQHTNPSLLKTPFH